jgi:hypothetical protein
METDAAHRSRPVLSRRQRNWLLALHVVSGGGWLGAASCMLLISWTNLDPSQHYAVNLVMERLDTFAMIPLPLAAIATGILLSWGTLWGFFRWYWVLAKQVVTYALLLLAPFTVHEWIVQMAGLSHAGVAGASYAEPQRLHVLASAAIVVTGAAIVTISVLKPWGRRGRGSGGRPRTARQRPVRSGWTMVAGDLGCPAAPDGTATTGHIPSVGGGRS